MRKMRKGKKMLLILIIAAIAIIVALIIKKIVKKQPSPEEIPKYEPVIQLPEIVYSGMEVKNIQMEYLENNHETIIRMKFCNTTSKKVENERFDILWVGPNEQVLGEFDESIESLDVGEEFDFNTILPGNLTETKEVKLIKK